MKFFGDIIATQGVRGNADTATDLIPKLFTTITAATEGWYRVATMPISSKFKTALFKVKAYTATGTTTESTICIDTAYYSGSYGSQLSSITANTSHSHNASTNAENGYVLLWCRISFDASNAYIDLYKYKTTAVTIEIEPICDSDWIWATGALTVNPTVGAYKNVTVTLDAGTRGSSMYAGSAGSATWCNYGVYGGNTVSNLNDKTGQWEYFGNWEFDYNSSYLNGKTGNIRVRMQELDNTGAVVGELDDFTLIIKVWLPVCADSTAFNTAVPTIDIKVEGDTTLNPTTDIAALVYSTSASQKIIRFYVKLKGANTIYCTNPEQRYGRSFGGANTYTTSYSYFNLAGDQAPIAALPTPAQGSVVYAVFVNRDLRAIEALTGVSGILVKTDTDEWSLDDTHLYDTTKHKQAQDIIEIASLSNAEGLSTVANANYSHAQGQYSIAGGICSHSEGYDNMACTKGAHAEGVKNYAGTGTKMTVASNTETVLTITSDAEKGAVLVAGALIDLYGPVGDTHNIANIAIGDVSTTDSITYTVTLLGVTLIVNTPYYAICHSGSDTSYPAHAEGQSNFATGQYSHAEGYSNNAVGQYAHAEGSTNSVTGTNGHAEGNNNIVSGNYSHAEGYNNNVSGGYSHVEGNNNILSSDMCHVEGSYNEARANYSHAEGYGTVAGTNTGASVNSNTTAGYMSHAEGNGTYASGNSAHSEGKGTKAAGLASHAEGYGGNASGPQAHAEGYYGTASGNYSHSEGQSTTSSGACSHAENYYATASGNYSHAEGANTTASSFASHVMGQYNKALTGSATVFATTSDAFVIGNGTGSAAKGNAFRVTYAGAVYGLSAFNSTGADYSEYFEWADGNEDGEDRVGYFVTLDGDKIRKATSLDDFILGIVSSTPSVIGDSYNDDWNGKYITDEWGRIQLHEVIVPTTYTVEHHDAIYDENNNLVTDAYDDYIVDVEEHTELQPVYNPDWDSSLQYIPREKRKEWVAIGMMGKLLVRDDGNCQINSYCSPDDNGIAVPSAVGYRVMQRISDNIIRILVK